MIEQTHIYSTEINSGKKKRRLFIPIAVAVVTVAVVGFLTSRAGLDKALVKQQIDRFVVEIKEKGRTQGRDIELTYGDLEVVGSFASKHVVIHDPALRIRPLKNEPQPVNKEIDALLITTPTISVYPQSVDLSALRVEAADLINFAALNAPDKSLLSIKSAAPITVSIARKKIGDREFRQVDYQSPTQILFTYLKEQQASGAEDLTPSIVPVYQSLQLNLDKGGGFTSSIARDESGLGEAEISLRNLVVTPQEAPEGALKLAEITASWSNALNENKLNAVHVAAKIGSVTSDNPALPYLPLALDIDATYEGMITGSPESISQVKEQESTMLLKVFSLTAKDASVKATGSFTANTADVLPVGRADITLSNTQFLLAELRKFGFVNPANEPLIASVAQKITGVPLAELKDVTIPVERVRSGSFKVGGTTFEELFAIFLKQAMQRKTAGTEDAVPQTARPSVPQLPPADKPKSMPIDVPDSSVRG